LSYALKREGNFIGALAAAQRSISLTPSSATYHFQLGSLYFDLSFERAAIKYFEQAVKIDRRLTKAFMMLGTAYA